MASFTDNFTRANGAIGANYTQVISSNSLVVDTNRVTSHNTEDQFHKVTSVSPEGPNQNVIATWISDADDGNFFLCARVTGTSSSNFCCYWIKWNAFFNGGHIASVNNNVETVISSGGAFATSVTLTTSDTIGIRANGNTISLLKNGSIVTSATDTTWAGVTGTYGIGFSLLSSNQIVMDDFVCTDIVAASRRMTTLGVS